MKLMKTALRKASFSHRFNQIHDGLVNIKNSLNNEKISSLFSRDAIGHSSSIDQKSLLAYWRTLRQAEVVMTDFDHVGFSVFSQNNEDGIILYIFSVIGTTNKLFVEIGANCSGSSIGVPENNTANLFVYHGWNGLILDGSHDNVEGIVHFVARCRQTQHFHWSDRASRQAGDSHYYLPMCKQAFVTHSNINSCLQKNNIAGEIDLFSLDIDGMDYHAWSALEVISPRVVVIEFNQRIGMTLASAFPPCIDDYVVNTSQENAWNCNGSSLAAMVELGKSKGYRFVGVNSAGFNAFFIRDDVAPEHFPAVSIEEVKKHPRYYWHKESDYTSYEDYQRYWAQVCDNMTARPE